jgi:hypothetical protein
MPPPPLIILPLLAIFMSNAPQHRRIDPERGGLNVAAGRMTVATIGGIGDSRDHRYPGRVW